MFKDMCEIPRVPKGPRDFWNFYKALGSEIGILIWNGEQLKENYLRTL